MRTCLAFVVLYESCAADMDDVIKENAHLETRFMLVGAGEKLLNYLPFKHISNYI